MKSLKYILLLTAFIFALSCESDDIDKSSERDTVVTTLDITASIIDDVTNGTVIAKVKGRTNNGQVRFAIASQTPDGALIIDEIFGDLTVADETLINAATAPEINLVVNITNGDVSKTSNITITVNAAPVDNDGDGILNDTDPDDNSPCFPVQNPSYIGFDATNAIWMAADCDNDGTINSDEVANGTDPYLNDTVPCDSTVDTSIWEGNFTITETLPFGTFPTDSTEPAIAGCGTLIIPDPNGFGPCDADGESADILFTLTPDFPGATTGTLVALGQPYVCGFIDDTYSATGTYDESTQTLIINDNISFAGSVTITPRD
ncbi:hypothetical protein [uncultured Algibacter sp.]|uniref:hypothetical protein n=1 Tax=uncultured Algibacter sp. TaxID=298659 RepID=UPI003216FA71